jgi:hypothetical protein
MGRFVGNRVDREGHQKVHPTETLRSKGKRSKNKEKKAEDRKSKRAQRKRSSKKTRASLDVKNREVNVARKKKFKH